MSNAHLPAPSLKPKQQHESTLPLCSTTFCILMIRVHLRMPCLVRLMLSSLRSSSNICRCPTFSKLFLDCCSQADTR